MSERSPTYRGLTTGISTATCWRVRQTRWAVRERIAVTRRGFQAWCREPNADQGSGLFDRRQHVADFVRRHAPAEAPLPPVLPGDGFVDEEAQARVYEPLQQRSGLQTDADAHNFETLVAVEARHFTHRLF